MNSPAPQPEQERITSGIRVGVTIVTLLVLTALVEFASFTDTQRLASLADTVLKTIGPWLMGLATIALPGLLCAAIAPTGRYRIGDQSKPLLDRLSWTGIIIVAGLGSGIVHWSVAEPLLHFQESMPGVDTTDVNVATGSRARAIDALATTWLHWGMHFWSITALWTVAMTYITRIRRGLFSAPFIALATFAVATTSVVALQHLFFSVDPLITPTLIDLVVVNGGNQTRIPLASITTGALVLLALTIFCVVSGMRVGLRAVAALTVVATVALWILVYQHSPIRNDPGLASSGLREYLSTSWSALPGHPLFEDPRWHSIWTSYYAVWWFAAAPIMAMFIVRISSGRQIRDVIFTVLIGGSLTSMIWIGIFSASALGGELGGSYITGDVALNIQEAGVILVNSVVPGEASGLGAWLIALVTACLLVTTVSAVVYALSHWSANNTGIPIAIIAPAWGAAILLMIMFMTLPGRQSAAEYIVIIAAPVLVCVLGAGLVGLIVEAVRTRRRRADVQS